MTYADVHIRRNGCHVVAGQTHALEDAREFDAALDKVSAHRRAKVRSYRFAKDQRLSLLAGLLLDELLADCGLRERDMVYGEGEGGKPEFTNRPDLHFSLAHSEHMAVAALALAPVGVDVEYSPTFPRDIAEPFLWTEMESVGKLLGCGVGEFVDSAEYHRPSETLVEHVSIDDYLICIARR